MSNVRSTVEVSWEIQGDLKSTYPRRSTAEIPDYIMEEYHMHGCSPQVVTDYLTNAFRFELFEWEWINEEKS